MSQEQAVRLGKCIAEIPFNRINPGMKVAFTNGNKILAGTVIITKHAPFAFDHDLSLDDKNAENQIGVSLDNGPLVGILHSNKNPHHALNDPKYWYFVE